MDDSSVPIFAQAKLEYTKQLVDVLYMNMYDGLRSIYDDSKKLYTQKSSSIIFIFRSLLEKVPTWNTEIIDSETERIMKTSKCDWLDDLLTAVFISHTRILMSIGPNQNYNKINVTIPKTTTFIHKSYINIAREVWKNPYLFNEQVPGHEYQRNMKQLEDMIKLTIEDTIRRQLPIKEILREHLETYDEPKQTTQKPIDMRMIMDEIKKAGLQQTEVNEGEPEEHTDQYEPDESKESNDIIFNKEDDNLPSNETFPLNEPLSNKVEELVSNKVEELVSNKVEEPVNSYIPSPIVEDRYKDPEDPSDTQIQNATQNIIINDITEPVMVQEEKYDNTDIIKETIVSKDDTSKKLNEMMNELKKPSFEVVSNVPNPSIKPVTTEIKTKSNPITSVIKIDDSPIIIKLDEVKAEPPKAEPPKAEPPKAEPPKAEPPPFSFSNLYPNLSGTGNVEDITKKEEEVKKEEAVKDINASIMKAVVSLDKKEDEIDETITLDNFFNDVKQMSNPMAPIQEETKYTLFEDASIKE